MINIEFLKQNIHKSSSATICEFINAINTFNMGKDMLIFCMTELADRRRGGEQFEYEKHIEKITPFPKTSIRSYNNVKPIK